MAAPASDTHILPPLEELEMHSSLASRNAAMLRCLHLAEAVAPAPVPVAITGEVGAGKSLVARFIHAKSAFRDRPCLNLNCRNLGASETRNRLLGGTAGGLLSGAAGGSLVLDGANAMSGQGQRELLGILHGGGSGPGRMRFISTIEMGGDSGNFLLEELVHILAESVVRIPPLRERREDIGPLAERALRTANRIFRKNVREFSRGARDFILHYDYPGNVRELFVIIQQAVRQSQRQALVAEDFASVAETPPDAAGAPAHSAPPLSLAEIEKRHLVMTLLRTGWKKRAAARTLRITETMLARKMKLYQLEQEE